MLFRSVSQSRYCKNEWPKLIIWDECHTFYKSVTDIVEKSPEAKVIGLTATPFTKGMGKLFTNVVNTTTTNKLIADKWLVPLKAYIATTIDMTGAETKFDGEWKTQTPTKIPTPTRTPTATARAPSLKRMILAV